MSTYEEMIGKIDQELEDIEFVEREAAKRGMQPGDYDLFSALAARKEDRQREEADLAEKLAQDLATPAPPMGPPTASDTGSGGAAPSYQRTAQPQQPLPQTTINDQAATSGPVPVNTFDLSNSRYTNIDPDAYLLTLAQQDKTIDSSDPKAMQKWLETVGENNLIPGIRPTINFSQQREDLNWKVVEDININDPGVREEVANSPQMKAWMAKNQGKFKKMPEDFLVVQSKTETNNGKPVTYIRPNITEEWYNENAKYDLDNRNLYPMLERQKEIVKDNPDKSLEEIEKIFGSMERYRKWDKEQNSKKKD